MTRAGKPRGASRLARLFFALCAAAPAASSSQPESVLALHDPSANGGGAGVAARFQAFVGDDPLPMAQYKKDWQGEYRPRDGDNSGLLSARAELAVQAGGWELAGLRRREIAIRMNRDTTDLMRLYKSKTDAAVDTHFAVDAEYRAVDLSGWRIGRAWRWRSGDAASLAAGIAWSELTASHTRDGNIAGSFDALGAGSYRHRIAYDDAWDRKTYPFQTPGTPSARGTALDVALAWEEDGGARYSLVGNDLFGRLHWHDLPGTQASSASSGTTVTDADGYINYRPALSGRNARRNVLQRLPERWALGAALPWREFTLYGSLARQQGERFALLGAAWNYSALGRLQADYDLRFGTLGISWSWRQLHVGLRSSARSLETAHAYGLSAGLAWEF